MLSLEDRCFPSEALQSHWRGGVGEARSPPAKRQKGEGEEVARFRRQNWEGCQMRLVKAERDNTSYRMGSTQEQHDARQRVSPLLKTTEKVEIEKSHL